MHFMTILLGEGGGGKANKSVNTTSCKQIWSIECVLADWIVPVPKLQKYFLPIPYLWGGIYLTDGTKRQLKDVSILISLHDTTISTMFPTLYSYEIHEWHIFEHVTVHKLHNSCSFDTLAYNYLNCLKK